MVSGTSEEDDWDWEFSPRADDQFARLDRATQERIVSKLDEIVASEWRDPADYLEPLTNLLSLEGTALAGILHYFSHQQIRSWERIYYPPRTMGT